jgi:hypothetical protein
MRLHPFGRGTLIAASLAVLCFGVPAVVVRLADAGPGVLLLASVVGAGVYLTAVWRLREVVQLDGLLRRRRHSRHVAAGDGRAGGRA